MNLPLILKDLDAKRIAWIITHENRYHRSQHLIKDRLGRLEQAAGHSLRNNGEVRLFLQEFLTGSSLFFSFLYICASLPDNVESIGTRRIEKYIRFVGNLFSNKEISHKYNHIINEHEIYLYCVKKPYVLVLRASIKGKLFTLFNLWNILFDFIPITFRGFRNDADRIINIICSNDRLKRYNSYLSSAFSVFKNQTSEIEQHKADELLDSQAIESLSEFEHMLLGLYLPIFDRYGDADYRILTECDLIFNIYKNNSSEEDPQWIIISPSYGLPIWFEDFFNRSAMMIAFSLSNLILIIGQKKKSYE